MGWQVAPLSAIDAIIDEGQKEIEMLLANGALNVLAKIVSSTREDENGDNNMQLEALSPHRESVKAGYGSAQSRGEGAVSSVQTSWIL